MERVLAIAGSDSSGGAGLEADQKVIAAHGCYAMTATTALTAQNTQGVADIHYIPAEFVTKQIQACLEDIGADAVKLGMLASKETVQAVSQALKKLYATKTLVVDPVMVATSGAQLLPRDAIQSLREDLLPITTILTPNIPEAELLLENAGYQRREIQTVDELKAMAKAVRTLGPRFVLLKGGHIPFNKDGTTAKHDTSTATKVFDVLSGDDIELVIENVFLKSRNTHGTGCSLSSAIACNLAKKMRVEAAVRKAIAFVGAGISTSVSMGRDSGPINHFHSTYNLPFSPGHFIEYILDRDEVRTAWKAHTEHKFVAQLADGTLPIESFKRYLVQDYLFLIQFMRANALAAYKAKTVEDIGMSASIVQHIHREMSLHLDYCSEHGISKAEIEKAEESQACTAYTRYTLDIGQAEDWLALQIAFTPCLLGYAVIARRLYDDPKTLRQGNRYWKWIENYVADDYTEAANTGSELLERHAVNQSPSRIAELVRIFVRATKLETGFWDMGLAST